MTAPAVGEKVWVVHTCTLHPEPVEGEFVIEAVVAMKASPEWRIEATRCDGTPMTWYVRRTS